MASKIWISQKLHRAQRNIMKVKDRHFLQTVQFYALKTYNIGYKPHNFLFLKIQSEESQAAHQWLVAAEPIRFEKNFTNSS